jgi:hypothetical protein
MHECRRPRERQILGGFRVANAVVSLGHRPS